MAGEIPKILDKVRIYTSGVPAGKGLKKNLPLHLSLSKSSMKKTFKELNEIYKTYQSLVQSHPNVDNMKLGYAYHRFYLKNMEAPFKAYNLALGMIRIDNALTKKDTGEILTDPAPNGPGFKYDIQGHKKMIEQCADLEEEWNKKEYEVDPFIAKEFPSFLTEYQQDVFVDCIISRKPDGELHTTN